ncbi:dynamin family protein [Janthinobacterium aquaticum]|uniref:dynamin family protein n=1 Tax=Janthinobacterium sp. FT58W TaxID=2654254 RepID=UPI0012654EC4|nr:dynamin family protein [Janthinobacterium sp. FT58W]KAB8041982.1 GTPase [Janthinobacterium sp. FT58W]
MVRDLEQYSAWRQDVRTALQAYQQAAQAAALVDGATGLRLARCLSRLLDDRLSVAFVAEFSRGKSELINAIFFADYGQRILPSGAGRTTMCPTELLYHAGWEPSIRLLPIETRAHNLSTSDYRDLPGAWTVLPLNLDAGDDMQEAVRQVSLTRRVSVEDATRYGLYDADDADASAMLGEDGLVEISMWRHAIINFPHPLLKQGLVILDTPGLNAIGTEPELTLNLIPNAHAVLFILAADTGVTRSDIEVWRNHIGADGAKGTGRLVVLNKIDSMWDELRASEEVSQAIARQQASVAHLLALDEAQVFPVSAQKALVGKINHDHALLEKSRLLPLEAALFNELIPARKNIIRHQLDFDLAAILAAQQVQCTARARGIAEQLHELHSLRGKNQSVIAHMMRRVDIEKKQFDSSVFKLQATRAVFTRLSTELYTSLGMDIVRDDIDAVRLAMQRSRFFTGLREAVRQYFERIGQNLDRSERKTAEIADMMAGMYRKFAAEHGLTLATPMPFTLARYRQQISDIEAAYHQQFGTATLLTTSRVVLMEKFFDTIASRVRRSFTEANDDASAWLKVIMAPLEAQIVDYKEQLKLRFASIQRIHDATGTLEQKIASFEASLAALERDRQQLAQLAALLRQAIDA